MNTNQIKFQKYINRFQMVILFAAMTGLLGTVGWVTAGLAGVKFALILACLSWLFSPALPSKLVMRLYRARPLSFHQIPELYRITRVLAQRAGLRQAPVLYLLPGTSMAAFATGSENDPAIGLGQGLIRNLPATEMAGILGHEISHIRNNDMQVMGYASLFWRITYYVSLAGQVGLIFLIPMAWMSEGRLPIIPTLVIALAPAVSLLLNQALSRSREYEADLGSAMLTGNPDYLGAALTRLELYRRNRGRWFGLPMAPDPANSLLSTHPPTTKRIRRLHSYKNDRGRFTHGGPVPGWG